ncbi:MAG: hypothetical protein JOZ77_00585 [Candidatus Eremiobacteraeota bacterium]|nr:hypothetical protein [Candidatus Eremiobacteraeota bacterium]
MSKLASRARLAGFGVAAAILAATLCGARIAQAQTAADVAAAVDKTCAVMSGERKADSQTLQYLLLLDEDLADANPVAVALYRGVVHQCPKAYLSYEQRKRTSNPFANSGLVSGTQTALTSGASSSAGHSTPAVFAMRCRGHGGMASAQGLTLTVRFEKADHPAVQSLLPGQCSWLDRGVRPNEPSIISVPLGSAAEAQNGVAQINAGGTWTFWVYNANGSFRATEVAKGTPAKP